MPDKHVPEPEPHKFTRLSREHERHSTETCFCGKFAAGDALRNASTFDVDVHVRQCALKLQEKPLLAKLSAGDLIAQEAKYHPHCLTTLYNKAWGAKHQNLMWMVLTRMAFAGLVSYIGICCVWTCVQLLDLLDLCPILAFAVSGLVSCSGIIWHLLDLCPILRKCVWTVLLHPCSN